MPPQVQRIALRTAQTGVQWWLNNKRLGPATLRHWQPWPGRHVLSLRNKSNRLEELFVSLVQKNLVEDKA